MKFKEWLITEEHGERIPTIFRRTYYAVPTESQLDEFESYPNLTAEEIFQGFNYTIVGRGVKSDRNNKMIIDSIQMLIDRYPNNKTYREVMSLAKQNGLRAG